MRTSQIVVHVRKKRTTKNLRDRREAALEEQRRKSGSRDGADDERAGTGTVAPSSFRSALALVRDEATVWIDGCDPFLIRSCFTSLAARHKNWIQPGYRGRIATDLFQRHAGPSFRASERRSNRLVGGISPLVAVGFDRPMAASVWHAVQGRRPTDRPMPDGRRRCPIGGRPFLSSSESHGGATKSGSGTAWGDWKDCRVDPS
jgi:hypothetical protein